MRADVVSVVIGPAEHGVVRHALALAEATGVRVARWCDPAAATAALAQRCRGARLCHWHFTDRLYGDDAADAARRFIALTARVPVRHVVSLHDVPAGGRSARQARRIAAYRVIAEIADAIVVASDHERRRLRRAGIVDNVVVIPLPVAVTRAWPDRHSRIGPPGRGGIGPPTTLGVLGFVYPGKGHAEVLAAAAGLPDDIEVIALGRASPGHEQLVERLAGTAARAGRPFRVTGFLADDDLARATAEVTVPVVAARAVSASASIGTWLAAGRRPIAVRNGFVDELDRRGPGLLAPCRPDELGQAIRRALADPCTTWREGPVPAELGEAAVARVHRELYERVHR